jgi:hypothetical protein
MSNKNIYEALQRAEELFKEFVAMGGPGSGRHPEGKADVTIILPDSPEVEAYAIKAQESGKEIDHIGRKIAGMVGGQASVVDYKSSSSIARKANDYYKGNINKVKDAVRTTVIVEKQNIQQAIEKAKQIPGYVYTNERNPGTDSLGYKGHAIIFKTKNGMFGEVQINSPELTYAKEPESKARKMLGDVKYDELAKRTGIKGGLGHKLFEEWRALRGEHSASRKKEIEFESKQYYKQFFALINMKSNYEIIRDLVGAGKEVYFEWEFEEIALKYLGNDKWEAKNKGYGGPFPVKYDAMLLAEALLNNPRIMTKDQYDRY